MGHMGSRYAFEEPEEPLRFVTVFSSYEWSIMYDRCAVCFSHHLSHRGIVARPTDHGVKFCSGPCRRYFRRVCAKKMVY